MHENDSSYESARPWRLVVGMMVMNLRLQRPGQLRVQNPYGNEWQVITAGESSWEDDGALVPLTEWDGVEDGLRAWPDEQNGAIEQEPGQVVRLQRVVGLLARWRERADRLQKMALEYEEEDDCKNAIDCASAAQEIRDCALDLESAMAGKKPNDQAERQEERRR